LKTAASSVHRNRHNKHDYANIHACEPLTSKNVGVKFTSA